MLYTTRCTKKVLSTGKNYQQQLELDMEEQTGSK